MRGQPRRLLEIANVSSQWCFAERGPFGSKSGMASLTLPWRSSRSPRRTGYGSWLKIPSPC